MTQKNTICQAIPIHKPIRRAGYNISGFPFEHRLTGNSPQGQAFKERASVFASANMDVAEDATAL